MSIRNTLIVCILAVLGLHLIATAWLARRGMSNFEREMASRLHRELLEQTSGELAARARQLLLVYEKHHTDTPIPDLPERLNAYLPERYPASLMLFDAKGNPVHPLPQSAALGDANPPGVVMAFFERAKAGEASEMTLDNFQALASGDADDPVVIHLKAYPDRAIVLGIGQSQDLAGVRIESLSANSAALASQLQSRGMTFIVALGVLTLTLAWIVSHYAIFQPLARIISQAGDKPGRAGISWRGLAEYTGRLREVLAEKDAIRGKLEREVERRFQAEEERDRLKNTMDHALDAYERDLQNSYGQRLHEAQAIVMRREARAIQRHLSEPIENLWKQIANGGNPGLERAALQCLETVRALADHDADLPYAPRPVPLIGWLPGVANQFSKEHGVQVNTNVAEDARVNIDAESLRCAIEFLLENALDAAGAGSPIALDAARVDDNVEIRIIDRGPGIPAEARPHILTPFYTTDDDRDGIGLAVARSVIRQHGGSLKFQSEEAKGAAAIITLPVASAQ